MIHRFYVLSDGRYDTDDNLAIRYAGWTIKPVELRLKQHLYAANNPKHHCYNAHRSRWMRKVLADGGKVNVHLVLEFDTQDSPNLQWQDIETRLIAVCKEEGYNLTNLTNGGEGFIGYVPTAEVRQKMSIAQRGKKQTPEHIAKAAAARRGLKRSLETGRKISAALRGKKKTPEHVTKLSLANRGKKLSGETRSKMSSARRGKKQTPQHTKKIVAGLVGKSHSPERRKTNALAQQRLSPLTAEQVQAIRAEATGVHGEGKYLANKYGVCRATIIGIVQNKKWFNPNYIPPSKSLEMCYKRNSSIIGALSQAPSDFSSV